MSGCWLCPLRSISANASACFSLHLLSARYIGDLAGYGQKVTLTGLLTAHTALLKSHCRGDNAHSYACVRLFPTGTQYPAGSPITALLKSHCRGDNAHSYACVRLFSPRKYESILRGFYNAVSLPGDCHVTLAMTKSALHGKTQAFASNRRTPTCGWVLCPLKRTRSQYRMDVDGQNVTLTGLLGIGQF